MTFVERRRTATIRIDPDVWDQLVDRAKPGETPNGVLRRVFRLPKVKHPRRRPTLKAWEDGQ